MTDMDQQGPLQGLRVVEHASGVAASYAGRLLTAMGAETVMIEPPEGCPLRGEPPFLGGEPRESALFAYLAAGKRSVVCDLSAKDGQETFERLLNGAQILIDDTPLSRRGQLSLDNPALAERFPKLIHVSVLPFGAEGPKAHWQAQEINLIHSGGEGFLMPNGLSAELFPDRPPIKIGGHFAEFQGGVAAALSALAALWSGERQFVDVSIQDANVAVGSFAVQRYGDGSLEHRSTRSFRYGGVLECRDGYVELLMLEDRQWQALVKLMDSPDWAMDEDLDDPVERGARGAAINLAIRSWARKQNVAELVDRAQRLGVPMAPYKSPAQVLSGDHESARALFGQMEMPGRGTLPIQIAPFRFAAEPLPVRGAPPALGGDTNVLAGWEARPPKRKANA